MLAAQHNVASLQPQTQRLALHPSPTSPLAQQSGTKDAARPRSRLPSMIDPTFLPHAHSSRHLYSQALLSDQGKALQPDYRTSFRSANDVVRRLLPYHVWHVNSTDLEHVLSLHDGKRKTEIDDGSYPSSDEAYDLFSRYSRLARRAKRLRCELEGADSSTNAAHFGRESLYNLEKLSTDQERQLLIQEQEKLRKVKEDAINAGVSWEALMRLSASFGQASMHGQGWTSTSNDSIASPSSKINLPSTNDSFLYKTPATTPMHSATPRPPPYHSSFMPQVQSQGVSSAPNTPRPPAVKGARPRGRPRKSMPSSSTPRVDFQIPTLDNPVYPMALSTPRPNHASTSTSSTSNTSQPLQRPPTLTTSTRQSQSNKSNVANPNTSTIPSHPIPLVLPLSTLAQLSALGIAPIPAPHLLPAISAQQAHAQRMAQQQQNATSSKNPTTSTLATSAQNTLPLSSTIHSTAPRPAPLNQQEPALLMGITEAPLPPAASQGFAGKTEASSKLNPTTQQMLHVSVVLSKLTPSQLSGLATLMQGLQANVGISKATNSSAEVLASPK